MKILSSTNSKNGIQIMYYSIRKLYYVKVIDTATGQVLKEQTFTDKNRAIEIYFTYKYKLEFKFQNGSDN